MNINEINNINDVLCFFIYIRRDIEGLFGAWTYAVALRGKVYTTLFSFLNVGKITFNGRQLVEMEASARCSSLQDLVNGTDGFTNLTGIAKLFFKIRIPVSALYAAFLNAGAQRNNGLGYCFYFRNPLESTTAFAGNVGGSITITNCNYQCLEAGCRCKTFVVNT